jgi:hypothetical protein
VVKNKQKLAAYTIDDCKKLSGNLPSKLEKKVIFFHEYAREKLIKFWNDTRPGDFEVEKKDRL